MKEIKLNKNYICLVDDCDFDSVNLYKWTALKFRNTIYAGRCVYENKKRKLIFMHRYILGVTTSKIFVDHKDHNGLNNQRWNIRTCTNSENQKNKKSRGTSKYLGVSYDNNRNKWVSQININGKTKGLGRFINEIDAAKKYDEHAKIYHLDFANLNFK